MENVLRDRSECGGLEGAGAGARDAEMAPRDPLHHGPAFPICVIGIQWYQPGNWPVIYQWMVGCFHILAIVNKAV